MGLEDSRQERPGRVLHPERAREHVQHDRRLVEGPLSLVVDHIWAVRWNRPERTELRQRVLSDPVVHLTVEDTGPRSTRTRLAPPLHGHPMPAALIHGPVTRTFAVTLPLTGRTSGVAFHPGGFAALFDVDASDLADQVMAADSRFQLGEVQQRVLAEPDEEVRRDIFTAWLDEIYAREADRLADDRAYASVTRAVDLMRRRDQVRIEPVAEAVACTARTLQRWFVRYVGLSPTRVLRRYRLQDATAALDAGEQDLAALAHDLGWADQAHFSREFRAMVGVPPQTYRRG